MVNLKTRSSILEFKKRYRKLSKKGKAKPKLANYHFSLRRFVIFYINEFYLMMKI